MELHFGYNCANYLPSLGKCRVLIDAYVRRPDLVSLKWLHAQDAFAYVGLSSKEVLDRIASGNIQVKLEKRKKLTYGVVAAWEHDDCPLAHAGGQCLYYDAHDGRKISCLAELRGLEKEHPNWSKVPLEEDIKVFEGALRKSFTAT